jgi:hypothetical protein
LGSKGIRILKNVAAKNNAVVAVKEVTPLPEHNIQSFLRRLSASGFPKTFTQKAILPEWWDESCESDASLLPELEIRVGRFLGMPIASLRNPEERLHPVLGARAQLRKAKNIERDRLAPAIHAGIRIAEAVLRVLKEPNRRVDMPPPDPAAWWHDLKVSVR